MIETTLCSEDRRADRRGPSAPAAAEGRPATGRGRRAELPSTREQVALRLLRALHADPLR